MSTGLERRFAAELRHELEALHGQWIWFVILGALLVVLVVIASLAVAVAIGVLLLIAGIGETIGAFWCRGWSGFFMHLLSGVLSIVVGVLFFRNPATADLALTVLIASFLMVGGIFKIIASMSYRFASWGWPLLSGIIDLILGIMIWQEWPTSAFWVIGLFLGINLIFRGFNWIGLGFALRSMPPAAKV
jgi:uncharacterized membrane protein HdeD (DUF308 family)